MAIYKTAGKNLYTANMDSIPPTSDSFLESELAQDGDYQDAGEISHLRRLYKQVLYFFIEENKIYDKMDAAISEVITSFKYSEGHRFKEVNFKHADMCCGYIFRYAAHGAALARCRILEGLDHCNELKSILMKKEVKLVSLGCGPGNDAIGFCSAMRRANFPGTLKILLVDAIENWSDYTLKAKQLLCNGYFGETSEFFQRNQVRLFKFYRCTLPEQLNFNLSEFDVVLICKLMSIMEIEKHDRFIQRLFLLMNKSALILFIDTPFYEDKWCQWFKVLYLSEENQDFCSGDSNMREFGNHHDCVTSKSRIAVLRKKSSY